MIHRHEPLKPDDLKADFAYQTIVLVKRAECNVDVGWHPLVLPACKTTMTVVFWSSWCGLHGIVYRLPVLYQTTIDGVY